MIARQHNGKISLLQVLGNNRTNTLALLDYMLNPFGKAVGVFLVNRFVMRLNIFMHVAMKKIIIGIEKTLPTWPIFWIKGIANRIECGNNPYAIIIAKTNNPQVP